MLQVAISPFSPNFACARVRNALCCRARNGAWCRLIHPLPRVRISRLPSTICLISPHRACVCVWNALCYLARSRLQGPLTLPLPQIHISPLLRARRAAVASSDSRALISPSILLSFSTLFLSSAGSHAVCVLPRCRLRVLHLRVPSRLLRSRCALLHILDSSCVLLFPSSCIALSWVLGRR